METKICNNFWSVKREFLPYLWGMETCRGKPFRDHGLGSYRTYEEWKHTGVFEWSSVYFGSYRTYEEWKLIEWMMHGNMVLCSYRTYEEWKHIMQLHKRWNELSSYRTYEEWKRSEEGIIQDRDGTFLPYLWGMETFKHHSNRWQGTMFLPYLWGMETNGIKNELASMFTSSYRTYEEWKPCICSTASCNSLSSYRTYEEWKLKRRDWDDKERNWFLPYLWGMETIAFSKVAKVDPWVLTVPMRNGNLNICSKSK